MIFQDVSNPDVKLFYSACGIITSIKSWNFSQEKNDSKTQSTESKKAEAEAMAFDLNEKKD